MKKKNSPGKVFEGVFDKAEGGGDETETMCVFVCVCVSVCASLRLICIWCVLLSGPNEGVHV